MNSSEIAGLKIVTMTIAELFTLPPNKQQLDDEVQMSVPTIKKAAEKAGLEYNFSFTSSQAVVRGTDAEFAIVELGGVYSKEQDRIDPNGEVYTYQATSIFAFISED